MQQNLIERKQPKSSEIDRYREQCEELDRILKTAQGNVRYISSKEWRDVVQELIKEKLTENLRELRNILGPPNTINYNSDASFIAKIKWNEGKQWVEEKMKVGAQRIDPVAANILDELLSCYNMNVSPVAQGKRQLIIIYFQSILKKLKKLVQYNLDVTPVKDENEYQNRLSDWKTHSEPGDVIFIYIQEADRWKACLLKNRSKEIEEKLVEPGSIFVQALEKIRSKQLSSYNKKELRYLLKRHRLFSNHIFKDSIYKPTFISYSWGDEQQAWRVSQLDKILRAAGVPVTLDIRDNKDGSITGFTERVNEEKSEFVLVIGTPSLRDKWEHPRGKVVPQELEQIGRRMRAEAGPKESEKGIILLMFDGDEDKSYPDYLRPNVAHNFSENRYYPIPIPQLLDLLIDRLYARYYPQHVEKADSLKKEFEKQCKEIINASNTEEIEALKQELMAFSYDTDNNNSSPSLATQIRFFESTQQTVLPVSQEVSSAQKEIVNKNLPYSPFWQSPPPSPVLSIESLLSKAEKKWMDAHSIRFAFTVHQEAENLINQLSTKDILKEIQTITDEETQTERYTVVLSTPELNTLHQNQPARPTPPPKPAHKKGTPVGLLTQPDPEPTLSSSNPGMS